MIYLQLSIIFYAVYCTIKLLDIMKAHKEERREFKREIQSLKSRSLVLEATVSVARNKLEHVEDMLGAILVERHVDREVVQ